ncbi:GDYXXLXY domain-containing protein [Thalassobacillus pellis]|uniref:GDYXXLXY domain-containing protein n=1 Tax=Thalassobacillus pellis TaxID=748008 RepID=UPI001961D8AB|nr:GDYXXLXY domain-containing protein [Thalassobacillus pellis]MBM7554087.1 putative membrane-anchored protein [Thalassobacillus pellis]
MKRIAFYVIVALQVLFLAGMSASYYAMDTFGETIHLKTAPVDPTDLFYGDYVILNYEIEEITEEKWSGEEPSHGEKVYVLLAEAEEGVYEVKKASTEKLEAGKGEVVLKGKHQWTDMSSSLHRISYGINRYYVEENTGRKYEQNQGGMIVEVVVAPWGQKKIVAINES